jgi:TonB family protein
MPEAEVHAVQPQAAVRDRPGTEPAQPYALHEVIPTVSASAARTIRGHVKVSVRAIVNPNGSVSAVLADRSGPSRYFTRLAVESAKKWTFPPAAASSSRIVQVQFEFGRDGTTAHAIPLP